MANPQKENGYTPIANEIMEAIYSSPFNSTQLKILLFILRYTYGFSRKEHKMSLNFISKGTGISRRYVSSELKKLVDLNIVQITKKHTDTDARVLKLNKNYEAWGNREFLQVKDCSTGEAEQDTTGEELITPTGEELFYQDKQNIKQNLKQNTIEQFEILWNLYPNKKGKAEAQKKIPALLKKHTLDELIRTVERYCKESNGKDKKYIQHGSTFFNKGYVDYLDVNYEAEVDKLDQKKDILSKYLEG